MIYILLYNIIYNINIYDSYNNIIAYILEYNYTRHSDTTIHSSFPMLTVALKGRHLYIYFYLNFTQKKMQAQGQ